VTWEGLWEASLPWATCVVLHTALGYLRFAQPLVVRRLVVGVPALAPLPDASEESWGKGGLVCGRLRGREQWCSSLDQVAASARSAAQAAGTATKDDTGRGLLFTNVGNSIHAIDEIAVIAAPPSGLTIALVEVVATLPSHPMHGLPAQRRVVLLRRPARGQDTKHVEPVLATVSRDAAIWNMNEVLNHHMQLRTPAVGARHAMASETAQSAQKELRSFQEMLQGLKAARIPPPPGVTFAQLKKEVKVLVASTNEIQDNDVLLHSKIESLLQQRLREKGLDGLVALQAAWQRLSKDAVTSATNAGKAKDDTSKAEETERVAAGDLQEPRSGSDSVGPDDHTVASAAPAVRPSAPPQGEQWTDVAVQAVEQASAELERKAAEVREKTKKAGGLAFQMDLQGGTIELRLAENTGGSLKELMSQFSKIRETGRPARTMAGSTEQGDDAAVGEEEPAEELVVDDPAERDAAGGDGDAADDVAARLSKVLAAVNSVTGGEEGVEAVGENAVQELLGPLQKALRENLQVEGMGEGSNPIKMQVHVVKLDQAVGGEGTEGAMAQMLQALLAQQQEGGGGRIGTVNQEDLQDAFLAAMGQAQQGDGASASGDELADGDADAGGGASEDVVAL